MIVRFAAAVQAIFIHRLQFLGFLLIGGKFRGERYQRYQQNGRVHLLKWIRVAFAGTGGPNDVSVVSGDRKTETVKNDTLCSFVNKHAVLFWAMWSATCGCGSAREDNLIGLSFYDGKSEHLH